ncbi:helix-turn-helix domain-containing protein [Paenibacillus flagellatus]|uniref:HTH araC/xylS-type domain-containing protein n=1 Tax=Paenibacillus flagellatus TaxID=2211139 RepID=A0A2V5KQZ6_9BACL|nr:helix-turn-helix domain-containing protein [Paenibacillus flagellatus]PYI53767.1 hypothetical protein DLM86_14480 [Paenibacillus flagellatus]
MKRNWFRRLLFSYMPVFVVICVTLLLISFQNMRVLADRAAVRSSESVVRNAKQLLEQSLRNIEEAMNDMVLVEPRIAAYYHSERAGRSEPGPLYDAAFALREMQDRLPMVHSLYLYKPEDDTVLEPGGRSPLSEFHDMPYIRGKLDSYDGFYWGDFRDWKDDPFSDRTTGIVSLAKIADLRSKGLLVVNIDVEALRSMLARSTDTSSGYLELTDASGRRIAGTVPERPEGHDRKRLAGETMANTGWRLEGGVLQPGITGWIVPALYTSIGVGVLCIAVGIVWIVYVSRRHYRPVESLIRQIGSLSIQRAPLASASAKEKPDEFQSISLALDSLLDRSNRLNEENEENKRFKRAHLFQRFAEGRVDPESAEFRRESKRLGLAMEGPCLGTILEIDRYAADVCNRFPEADRRLLKYALQTAAEESLRSRGYSVCSDWLAEHRCGVIIGTGDPGAHSAAVEEALEALREWVERHLPFTVTIGVGTEADGFATVSKSVRWAKEALAYKMTLGLNRVIPYRNVPEKLRPELLQELQTVKEIARLLRMGDPGWNDETERLLASLQGGGYGSEQVLNLSYMLLFHVQRELADVPPEQLSSWFADSTRLEESLRMAETMGEIGDTIRTVLAATWDSLEQWREANKHSGILQDIKAFIDERYADPNLSLSMLGDRFGLHTTTISRLFKEEFGVKFVDYVNGRRVQQAIQLIENDTLTAGEIADRIGFAHPQSFIRIFKKHTGYTPGTYRKEAATGAE